MSANIQNQSFGKPVRLIVCDAVACAITGVTTQVIISSAGDHEYEIASTTPSAAVAASDPRWRINVARAL
jgi:hypothetical protein